MQIYPPSFRNRKRGKRFSRLKRRRESELHLRLADFYLFWAETGYSLPLASLFTLFSESKKRQKIFAAQTPPRKRGFFSTHQTIVGKTSQHLRNSFSSLADAPHCSIWGSVQNYCFIGTSVIFYIVIQSTGLVFLPSSLSRDDFAKF